MMAGDGPVREIFLSTRKQLKRAKLDSLIPHSVPRISDVRSHKLPPLTVFLLRNTLLWRALLLSIG